MASCGPMGPRQSVGVGMVVLSSMRRKAGGDQCRQLRPQVVRQDGVHFHAGLDLDLARWWRGVGLKREPTRSDWRSTAMRTDDARDAQLLRPRVVQQTLVPYSQRTNCPTAASPTTWARPATPTSLRVGRGQRPDVSSSSDVVAWGRYTTDVEARPPAPGIDLRLLPTAR
jgi:hypothetical protein